MARLSIRTKLPLAIGAVVVIVGASIAAAAGFVIHRTAYARAEERLVSLTESLSNRLVSGVNAAQTRAAATASRPEVVR